MDPPRGRLLLRLPWVSDHIARSNFVQRCKRSSCSRALHASHSGKWHLGYLPRYSPLKSGYEEFFGVMGGFTGYYAHIGDSGEHDLYEGETPAERAGYVTDMLSERAAAWIADAAAQAKPYFLSLHYTAPHWPWSAPSVEAAARQRETERSELTEGGNTRIFGVEVFDGLLAPMRITGLALLTACVWCPGLRLAGDCPQRAQPLAAQD